MMGLTVNFLWVPAHIGIQGNEMEDKAAKEAFKNNEINLSVSISKNVFKSIKEKLKVSW